MLFGNLNALQKMSRSLHYLLIAQGGKGKGGRMNNDTKLQPVTVCCYTFALSLLPPFPTTGGEGGSRMN